MDQFIGDEGKFGHGFTSADQLKKIDLGDGRKPRPTYINAKLDPKYKAELIALLKEFKDCFAREYYEMLGLDRSIVEHRLPIKLGFRPFQQHPRQCNPKIWLARLATDWGVTCVARGGDILLSRQHSEMAAE
jgi:hypothetical protein